MFPRTHSTCQLLNIYNKPTQQFILQIEQDNELTSLDVLLMKQGKHLQHTVYRKPTHTSRHLNAELHHHSSQIQAVANILTSRLNKLTNAQTRKQEINKITKELKKKQTLYELNPKSH